MLSSEVLKSSAARAGCAALPAALQVTAAISQCLGGHGSVLPGLEKAACADGEMEATVAKRGMVPLFDPDQFQRVFHMAGNGIAQCATKTVCRKLRTSAQRVALVTALPTQLTDCGRRAGHGMAAAVVLLDQRQTGSVMQGVGGWSGWFKVDTRHFGSAGRSVAFGGLSLPRPPPPVALLQRKLRVASLSDGATERIEDAGVLAGFGEIAKRLVE